MKNVFFILLLFIGVSQVSAQKPVFTTAKLNSALFYLRGAELTHTTTVNLQKGTNEVVVKNVANQLDDNSIRVKSNKTITVMSASFSNRYYTEYEIDPNSMAMKKLKDSVEWTQKEIANVNNKIEMERQAIVMLDKNQAVGGQNTGVNVVELSKMMEYFRQKRLDFADNIYKYNQDAKKLNETLNRLKNQMNARESDQEKISNGKVVLQIMSDVAQTVQLEISYITNLASWQPFYEVESKGIDQPVHLISKAKVYQTTGFDWKQVKLTMSSSQPNPNNAVPELYQWYLSVRQPVRALSGNYYKKSESIMAEADSYVAAPPAPNKMEKVNSAANYTAVTEQTLSVNYDISIPYDIYANGKPHTVTLQEQDLPATYSYYVVPKLNTDAYLIAHITDYAKYNLLKGEANIIFEGTYVGKTYIDPSSTKDTLELALGVDKGVVVTRNKIAEKSGNKIFSNNREAASTYEIAIRNNKKIAIEIAVKDQFPLSSDKEIIVELNDKSGGTVDNEQGTISWDLKIKPQSTQKLRFGYTVKYPKNKVIYNL